MTATRRNPPTPASKNTPAITPSVRSTENPPWRRFLAISTARHMQAALLSLGQMMKAPYTTLLIVMVIGIALALPAGLFVLLDNMKTLSQQWNSPAPIVLYLKTQVQNDAAITLAKQIGDRPEINKAIYISPREGMAAFQQQSGLNNLLDTLKDNPLPGVLVITPKTAWQTADQMAALVDTFKQLPQVDVAQLDLQWVQRLQGLLLLGTRLAYGIGFLLCLGVIFIIGGTIHLATQSQREEIFIFQLVGASKRFIRRPFLYTGIWYGLFGSIIAWLLLIVAYVWLHQPVTALASLYGGSFRLHLLDFGETLILWLLGILLGWVGAWLAVYRQTA